MARMHEILGVEPYEDFKVKGQAGEYCLDKNGDPLQTIFEGNRIGGVYGFVITAAINHGIIRRPRYTPKQAEVLKALKVIGYADGFLTKDSDGTVFAHKTKPYKGCEEWLGSKTYSFIPGNIGLVSWDDDEPLSIAQALLDAGVD